MVKRMSAKDARNRFAELLGQVQYGKDTIIVEKRGRVGWLIFNRPQALNAMNARLMEETAQAWIELDTDPGVRVIVNSGIGRGFNTGVAELESGLPALGQ